MYPATLADPLWRFNIELVPGTLFSYVERVQNITVLILQVIELEWECLLHRKKTLDSFFPLKELQIRKINFI